MELKAGGGEKKKEAPFFFINPPIADIVRVFLGFLSRMPSRLFFGEYEIPKDSLYSTDRRPI